MSLPGYLRLHSMALMWEGDTLIIWARSFCFMYLRCLAMRISLPIPSVITFMWSKVLTKKQIYAYVANKKLSTGVVFMKSVCRFAAMNLATAQVIANELVERIRPYCDRVDIALFLPIPHNYYRQLVIQIFLQIGNKVGSLVP